MQSIWMKDYEDKNLPKIKENKETPVLIIGGGLSGLLCAYNFMKNNIKFILVEANKMANGVSANTTAQISIAHDNIFDEIKTKHGKEKSVAYLKSQLEGLNIIKNIIKTENISCDYKEESTMLCATEEKNIEALKNTYRIIKKHNKNCKLIVLDNEKCIEFKNQIIINPIKYMMGIVDILIKNNIPLYENSNVTKIDKKSNIYEVSINDEYIIKTKKIIMASHYPFLNPDNLYFTKVYQSSSYAVAFKTKLKINYNYVSLDSPYYYLRTYNKDTLIIGGCDHFTGIDNDIADCYNLLIKKIHELDKKAEIKCKWFTEDCMVIDSLPFVGKYSIKNPNIILVTGFQKWGFTNAHIAAKNITNMLTNKKFDKLYKTYRFTLFRDLKSTFRMIGHSVNGLVLSKLFIKKYNLNKLEIGSGKVMRYKNTNVLVYKEDQNKYVFLKNKCTHMGCSLIWNDVDKVWESKCHGSIFDKYGHVIYGPALKDLERLNL